MQGARKKSRILKRNLPTSGALLKLQTTSLHHQTGEEERGGRSYIQTQFAQVGSDFMFTYSLSVRSVPGENGRYESMLVIRNVYGRTRRPFLRVFFHNVKNFRKARDFELRVSWIAIGIMIDKFTLIGNDRMAL